MEDYNELERIFTVELGTAEDYEMNYQDTPFGLLIRKIAKMDRTAAYAAFSTFILEERPNTEQLHFIEQVVDYVVENGYINNVLDLMKTPFDRPYKFSLIFTYEEQVKFVKIINNIKNNALVSPILTFILLMIAGTEEGSTTFVSACLRFPCSVYISLIFS